MGSDPFRAVLLPDLSCFMQTGLQLHFAVLHCVSTTGSRHDIEHSVASVPWDSQIFLVFGLSVFCPFRFCPFLLPVSSFVDVRFFCIVVSRLVLAACVCGVWCVLSWVRFFRVVSLSVVTRCMSFLSVSCVSVSLRVLSVSCPSAVRFFCSSSVSFVAGVSA